MDSIRVSEALDPRSIRGEATLQNACFSNTSLKKIQQFSGFAFNGPSINAGNNWIFVMIERFDAVSIQPLQ